MFTKILDQFEKLFALLPFNGDKAKIGGTVSILALVHQWFPDLDLLAMFDSKVAQLGLGVLIVGLLHKAVKKALDKLDPEGLVHKSQDADVSA